MMVFLSHFSWLLLTAPSCKLVSSNICLGRKNPIPPLWWDFSFNLHIAHSLTPTTTWMPAMATQLTPPLSLAFSLDFTKSYRGLKLKMLLRASRRCCQNKMRLCSYSRTYVRTDVLLYYVLILTNESKIH